MIHSTKVIKAQLTLYIALHQDHIAGGIALSIRLAYDLSVNAVRTQGNSGYSSLTTSKQNDPEVPNHMNLLSLEEAWRQVSYYCANSAQLHS